MICIRFGSWSHKATSMFLYNRVYKNGCEWTPICIKKFRYIGISMTDDDIKDLYGDAHRLMNAIMYDEKLDHLNDEDFETIWSHIKAHYELK